MNQETKDLFQDVIKHRASIINDFYKAYLAENVMKLIKIKDLELVEERNAEGFTWHFRPKTKKRVSKVK